MNVCYSIVSFETWIVINLKNYIWLINIKFASWYQNIGKIYRKNANQYLTLPGLQ